MQSQLLQRNRFDVHTRKEELVGRMGVSRATTDVGGIITNSGHHRCVANC